MSAKFELFQDKRGEYRFRLKAGNGEMLLASSGYSTKAAALNGIVSVQKNALYLRRFQVKISSLGKPYFSMTAANGQEIGRSEIFSSEIACDNGVKSVMYSAPLATIVEDARLVSRH